MSVPPHPFTITFLAHQRREDIQTEAARERLAVLAVGGNPTSAVCRTGDTARCRLPVIRSWRIQVRAERAEPCSPLPA